MAQHSLDSVPPLSLVTHVCSPGALAPGSVGKGLSQVLTGRPGGEPWALGVLTLCVLSCVPDGQGTCTEATAATGLLSCPPLSLLPHTYTPQGPHNLLPPEHVLLESDVDIVRVFVMMSLAGPLVDPATDLVCSVCL